MDQEIPYSRCCSVIPSVNEIDRMQSSRKKKLGIPHWTKSSSLDKPEGWGQRSKMGADHLNGNNIFL